MNIADELFSWFLEASMRGTALAFMVLFIQWMLRGRMPAKWRYALWTPVILVLAAPSLPHSGLSLENQRLVEVLHPTISLQSLEFTQPVQRATAEPTPTTPSAPTRQINWRQVLAVIWIIGVIGTLFIGTTSYLRAMRAMRSRTHEPDKLTKAWLDETLELARLHRRPELLVSDTIDSPAIAGISRPTLLLPSDFSKTFSAGEARLILLHELVHLKRFDLLVNGLLCLLQAVHWCNPLIWLVFARIRTDREISCDARVLEILGEEDKRRAYGRVLLKLDRPIDPRAWNLGFVGIFNPEAPLRKRVIAIANFRASNPLWAATSLILIGALLAAGATRAAINTPAPLYTQLAPTKAAKAKALTDEVFAELLKLQKEDGSFPMSPKGPSNSDAAITALAGLCLLSHGGADPESSSHQPILRATNFILATSRKSGKLGTIPGDSGSNYSFFITLTFLAKMHQVADRDLRAERSEMISPAINKTLEAQNLEKTPAHAGGWRYKLESRDSDLSCTGWGFRSLLESQKAGFEVPDAAFAAAKSYALRHRNPTNGGFCYSNGRTTSSSLPLTGIGLYILETTTGSEDQIAQQAASYIKSTRDNHQAYGLYGAAWCTQALAERSGEDQAEYISWLYAHCEQKWRDENRDKSPGGHIPIPLAFALAISR